MSRRALFTIAPHGRFLDLLVERVLDGTLLGDWPRSQPFWLSDVTILLPTKRSRLKLAELFAERLGGAAMLPDIRALGAEPGETEAPFLPPVDAPLLPPVASPLERRLTLARLVERFARLEQGFASPPNAAEIFRLADSLGELIDDLAIEGVSISRLKELMPEDLAKNWQDILVFLDIALKAWPKLLKARGQVDAAVARNERLLRQASTAPLMFGDRPVIAAGSTGSIPATAALLKAITRLPRGALVLPGLDTSLSPGQHAALLEGDTTEGHPQYGLARLLRELGAGIAEVDELAGAAPRTSLVRAALALPDDTTAWPQLRHSLPLGDALGGLTILAAPNVDLEARAIALAARQALADGKSVGIVSRDQTLARRIAAELLRHDIHADDPAGTPLYLSPTGRLARQVLAAVGNQFAPVDVVALLRNPAVTLGRDRAHVTTVNDKFDIDLRGESPVPGLAGLLAIADADGQALLEALGEAMEPVRASLTGDLDATALAVALRATTDALIGEANLPGLAEFRRWADEVASFADAGPAFAPVNLDGVLAALMSGAKVQTGEHRRDDIHIWGELEARLQNPDLMILAGVNEDIWPAPADPGAWLSRGMRLAIGLEPPERQQGQAAHDFEMAAGNSEVLIAYAERLGASPALPSRLLQRLDAFVGDAMAEDLRRAGTRWLAEAVQLDFAGAPRPASPPRPTPQSHLRPRKLSVTEIETLIRSPYDLYAKHVLRLRRLDPLGQLPDARERGSMVHRAFARFIEHHDIEAPDALAVLMRLAEEEFAGLEAIAERRDIWLSRFGRAAEQLLEFERERQDRIERRFAEIKGRVVFPELQNFVLSGIADRLDLLKDGGIEILDFKTGTVPTSKQMRTFEAPQLLLEAAMAAAGAFPGLPARTASALTYIKIGLGPDAFDVTRFKLAEAMSLADMIDAAWRRAQLHIEALLIRGDKAMAPRIRPDINRRYAGDYDHLARTDEWTLAAGADP